MAAAVKGKGQSVLAEITSVYTAIPQIISIDKSGEGSETFKARTLDGPVHDLQPNTGYCANPTWKLELLLDPANTVHVFLKTSMRTPPAAGVNFKHIDVASSPVTEIFNVTGIQIDEKISTNDGMKATVTLTTSGNPT